MLSIDDNKGKIVNDLENLLNLHGEVFPMDNGFWAKFEAYQVEISKFVPHGVRYSLTLHDKNNHRVIGYDNAHSFKSSKKYGAKKNHMTICINRWIPSPMNLSQHSNYLKTFGTV